MTDEQLILAVLAGKTDQAIATEFGLKRLAIATRVARLRKHGVHIPNRLYGRRKSVVDVAGLNALIARHNGHVDSTPEKP